jgi:GT2 family glycosyltransferase
MELSVIIVNWNVKDLLAQCLNSIYLQTRGQEVEIIVIDNASSDGSAEMVRSEFPRVRLIVNQQNQGFAKSCNKGIEIARGPFLLFLNPDTVILPHTLQKTVQFLKENTDVGMVGCKIVNPDGSLQYSCRSFPSLWNYFSESLFLHKIFPKNRWTGKFYGTSFPHDRVADVDVVLGAFMMSTKDVLDEVGCFDERFFIYSEETDLCYRLKERGKRVCFFPSAEIIHYGRASASQYPVEMFEEDHRSRFLFLRKHYSDITVILSTCLIFIGVILRIVLWSAVSLHAFAFKKTLLKNSIVKLKIFLNLFSWYLGFNFAK